MDFSARSSTATVRTVQRFLYLFLVCISLIFPSQAAGYSQGMAASVVIGQPSFTTGVANQGGSPAANTIKAPVGVHYDPSSKKLFVADSENNRVLIYNSIPTANNAAADVVVGQQNFSSSSINQGGSPTANSLSYPTNIFVANGRMIIADSNNNRVLIYNSIPTSNNAAADVVVGQQNFVSNSANQGGSRTARTLASAQGLASDGRKLYIVDTGGSRVLIYNSIPTANNAAADVVLGQADFSTGTPNQGGIGANTFHAPFPILLADGKLLVGDVQNLRTLVWNTIPTTNKASADVVIGQPNFTTAGVPAATFVSRRPTAIAYDGTRLFIANDFRQMVAIYNNGIPTTNFTPYSLTAGVHGVVSLDAVHMWGPWGVTTGENKLIVASRDGYNRVMIFDNVLGNPGISLNNTPEHRSNNLIRLAGSTSNVLPSTVSSVQYAANGAGFSVATPTDGSWGGSREDFFFDFDPKLNQFMNDQGQPLDGYTVRVRSANNNAEITQNLFYFTPFSLNSPADASAVSTNYPNFDFSVNKQRLNLQTNLTKYQVLIRKIEENGAGAWETYLDAVPVDHDGVYETTELYVTYSENSSRISVYSKLRPLQGAYEWKIAALDKEDHVQETETRKLYVNTSIPERITSSFPLTILSISGVKNVNLSTYNLVTIQNTYFTQSPNPVIYGIAYVNANVALTLTDRKCLSTSIDQSLCTKSYSTVANQDSRYGINIPSGDLRAGTLYTANASVSLHDFYNQLPPFTLVRGSVGN